MIWILCCLLFYGPGTIPAPAVLEVGSDKIWALLVLSELFGLRAVVAQCSQRLCRLCQAKNPLDVCVIMLPITTVNANT